MQGIGSPVVADVDGVSVVLDASVLTSQSVSHPVVVAPVVLGSTGSVVPDVLGEAVVAPVVVVSGMPVEPGPVVDALPVLGIDGPVEVPSVRCTQTPARPSPENCP
ncbi:MAG: hypothetical protein AAGA54_07080 [Myxococcota bacterium]